MTVFIILREAFLKDNNIRAIKRLKLRSFKCKSPNFIRTKDRHRITYVLAS